MHILFKGHKLFLFYRTFYLLDSDRLPTAWNGSRLHHGWEKRSPWKSAHFLSRSTLKIIYSKIFIGRLDLACLCWNTKLFIFLDLPQNIPKCTCWPVKLMIFTLRIHFFTKIIAKAFSNKITYSPIYYACLIEEIY